MLRVTLFFLFGFAYSKDAEPVFLPQVHPSDINGTLLLVSNGPSFQEDRQNEAASTLFQQEWMNTMPGFSQPAFTASYSQYFQSSASPNSLSSSEHSIATLHIVNTVVSDNDRHIHFVCHVEVHRLTTEGTQCCTIRVSTQQPSSVEGANIQNSLPIGTSAGSSSQYLSCSVSSSHKGANTCHLVAKLSQELWKSSILPTVIVNSMIHTISSLSTNRPFGMEGSSASAKCSLPSDYNGRGTNGRLSSFKYLGTVHLQRTLSPEPREIGDGIFVLVPRAQLKLGGKFQTPVCIRRYSNVQQFTLRLMLPRSVFVRVTSVTQLEKNGWEIQQDSSYNDTHITARLLYENEELAGSGAFGMDNMDSLRCILAIDLLVRKPPDGEVRLHSRLIWILINARWKDRPGRDHYLPVVTPLHVQSSYYQHLVAVWKWRWIYHMATLSGHNITYPVWIYGITHENNLEDVTDLATCYSDHPHILQFSGIYECHALLALPLSPVNLDKQGNFNSSLHSNSGLIMDESATSKKTLVPDVLLTAKYRGEHVQWIVGLRYPDFTNARFYIERQKLRAIQGWSTPVPTMKENTQEGYMKDMESVLDLVSEGRPSSTCRQKYQTSSVRVFLRFIQPNHIPTSPLPDNSKDPSNNLWFDVSHLAKIDILSESSAPPIAQFVTPRMQSTSHLLQGLLPGRLLMKPRFRESTTSFTPTHSSFEQQTQLLNVTVTQEESVVVMAWKTEWISDIHINVSTTSSTSATSSGYTNSADIQQGPNYFPPHYTVSVRVFNGGHFYYTGQRQVLLLSWGLSDGSFIPLTHLLSSEVQVELHNSRPDILHLSTEWQSKRQRFYDWPIVTLLKQEDKLISGPLITLTARAVHPQCMFPLSDELSLLQIHVIIEGNRNEVFKDSNKNISEMPLVSAASTLAPKNFGQLKNENATFRNHSPVVLDNTSEDFLHQQTPSDPSHQATNLRPFVRNEAPYNLMQPGAGMQNLRHEEASQDQSHSNNLPPHKLSNSLLDKRVLQSQDPDSLQELNSPLKSPSGKSRGFPGSSFIFSTNPSALELGMYILLGFLSLAALVFAVNCGFMIVRHKQRNGASVSGRIATIVRPQHCDYEMLRGKRRSSRPTSSTSSSLVIPTIFSDSAATEAAQTTVVHMRPASGILRHDSCHTGGSERSGQSSRRSNISQLFEKEAAISTKSGSSGSQQRDPDWVWLSRENLKNRHCVDGMGISSLSHSKPCHSPMTLDNGDVINSPGMFYEVQSNRGFSFTQETPSPACILRNTSSTSRSGPAPTPSVLPRKLSSQVADRGSISIRENPLRQFENSERMDRISAPSLPPRRHTSHNHERPRSQYFLPSKRVQNCQLVTSDGQKFFERSDYPNVSVGWIAHPPSQDSEVESHCYQALWKNESIFSPYPCAAETECAPHISHVNASRSLGRPSRLSLPPPPPPLRKESRYLPLQSATSPNRGSSVPQPPMRTTSRGLYPSPPAPDTIANITFRENEPSPNATSWSSGLQWDYATPEILNMLPKEFLVKYFSNLKESIA